MKELGELIGEFRQFKELAALRHFEIKEDLGEVKTDIKEAKRDIRKLQQLRWKIAGGVAAITALVGLFELLVQFK